MKHEIETSESRLDRPPERPGLVLLIWRFPRVVADWLIRFYQATLSQWSRGCCRFQPTCSQYARQAIAKYGLLWGGLKAAYRILRCHPFSRGGPDPLK